MKRVEAVVGINTFSFKDHLPKVNRSQPIEVVITSWHPESEINKIELSQFEVKKYSGGWQTDKKATEDWRDKRGPKVFLTGENKPKKLPARSMIPTKGNRPIKFTVTTYMKKGGKVGVDPVWQERP